MLTNYKLYGFLTQEDFVGSIINGNVEFALRLGSFQ